MKLRNIILTTVLLATFSACEDMFEPAKDLLSLLQKGASCKEFSMFLRNNRTNLTWVPCRCIMLKDLSPDDKPFKLLAVSG